MAEKEVSDRCEESAYYRRKCKMWLGGKRLAVSGEFVLSQRQIQTGAEKCVSLYIHDVWVSGWVAGV